LRARHEATTRSVIGAGKQAEHQIRAALTTRRFSKIILANRTRNNAEQLKQRLDDLLISVEVANFQTAAECADVIITIASSFLPLIERDWVAPGVHIAAMGTDTSGKCELDPDLFKDSLVYTDEPRQSASIGEAQHAVARGFLTVEDLIPIGSVAAGLMEGRKSEHDITIFDGTGVGLQDLAVAKIALEHRPAE